MLVSDSSSKYGRRSASIAAELATPPGCCCSPSPGEKAPLPALGGRTPVALLPPPATATATGIAAAEDGGECGEAIMPFVWLARANLLLMPEAPPAAETPEAWLSAAALLPAANCSSREGVIDPPPQAWGRSTEEAVVAFEAPAPALPSIKRTGRSPSVITMP